MCLSFNELGTCSHSRASLLLKHKYRQKQLYSLLSTQGTWFSLLSSGTLGSEQLITQIYLSRHVKNKVLIGEVTANIPIFESYEFVCLSKLGLCVVVQSLSRVQLFCKPMDCSPLGSSVERGFSREEYWSGLPFASPGDVLDSGIEPASPALKANLKC